MPYDYKFRVIVESYNCLSTFQFATVKETMDKMKALSSDGKQPQCYPIKHNNQPGRADYEYRMFDICILPKQVGIVLCLPNGEPEFHGFRNNLEDCFDYIDEYYYSRN